MEKMMVQSSVHSYPIYIGEKIRYSIHNYLTKEYSAILIITDQTVADLYLETLIGHLNASNIYQAIIPSGEESKRIDVFYQIHTKALQYGLDRNSLIIAFGGGVIGDLAGFVAATYMRGIDYIQMPTTILAHDSSVGGKVAINHELGKNMIGSFYPPIMVVYDVETLQSLSKREVRSGYAELIKEGLLADQVFFHNLLSTNLDQLNNHVLVEHLQKGMQIKATIVEQDEKESGVRKFLNLGHTLGHAIEAELSYGTFTHGEAVAIGILFACYVSEQEFGIDLPTDELIKWMEQNGYPIQFPKTLHADALLQKMKNDKKTINRHVQMVLLRDIAHPVTVNIDDDQLLHYLNTFLGKLVSK